MITKLFNVAIEKFIIISQYLMKISLIAGCLSSIERLLSLSCKYTLTSSRDGDVFCSDSKLNKSFSDTMEVTVFLCTELPNPLSLSFSRFVAILFSRSDSIQFNLNFGCVIAERRYSSFSKRLPNLTF